MGVTFGPSNKITIGVAIAAVAGAAVGTWHVFDALSEVNQRLDSLEKHVGERYTLAAASEQALREAIENPGHRVSRRYCSLADCERFGSALTY